MRKTRERRSDSQRRLHALALGAVCGLAAASVARGGSYEWSPALTNPSSGGSGTWDLTTADWLGPTTFVAWPDNASSTAVFQGTAGVVSLGTNITAGGLEFDTDGYQLTGPGTLTLAAPSSTILINTPAFGANRNATIDAPATASGDLFIDDGGPQATLNIGAGGALQVNGILTNSSDINVNGGTLVAGFLGGGVNAPSAIMNLTDPTGGVALVLNGNAGTQTYDGRIQGTGSILKTGNGTQILNAYNTAPFTGSTTINGGSIVDEDPSVLQNSTVHINVDNGLDLSQISGGGVGEPLIGNIAGSGALNLRNGLTVVLGNNDDTTYSGKLSGDADLIKNGSGTLTLTGSGSSIGSFTANGGAVNIAGGSLSIPRSFTVAAGGVSGGAVLNVTQSATVKNFTISGAGSLLHSHDFTTYGNLTSTVQSGGQLNVDTNINVGINSDTPTLLIGDGGTANSAYAVIDPYSSNAALTVSGSGKWTNSGNVDIGSDGVNSPEGSGKLTVMQGGTANIGGTVTTYGSFGSVVVFGGSLTTAHLASVTWYNQNGSLTVNDPTGGVALTINGASGSSEFAGNIIGTGSIRKTGGSNETLSGNNTFTGNTIIDGGTITVGNAQALQRSIVQVNIDNGLNLNGLPAASLGLLSGGGALNTGPTNLTIGANGGVATYSGTLSGSGSLTKIAGSFQTLSGSNTFSGGTTLNGGTLAITSDAALGTGPLTFGGGTLMLDNYTSHLDFNNAPVALAANTGLPSSLAGGITGQSSLSLSGDGNLILAGNNNYAGNTSVNGGTLTLAAPISLPGGIQNGSVLQVNANTSAGLLLGPGSYTVSSATLNATGMLLGSLDIKSGGVVHLLSGPMPANGVQNGLTIEAGGKLDIGGAPFQVSYISSGAALQPAATAAGSMIRSYIASAYDNGKWDGSSGLTTATADATRYVGYADSADGVVNLPANTIQLQIAAPGDANLSGSVDFADLLIVQANYGQSNTIWDQGDFNYDGITNFADLKLLAANYNGMPSASQFSELTPAFATDVEQAFSQVPEPSSIVLLCGGLALMLPRRRRSSVICSNAN